MSNWSDRNRLIESGPSDDDEVARAQAIIHHRIESDFTYHPPMSNQIERYEALRAAARTLAHDIAMLAPESRERSLALTNLEQAVMWANAAIARNE